MVTMVIRRFLPVIETSDNAPLNKRQDYTQYENTSRVSARCPER